MLEIEQLEFGFGDESATSMRFDLGLDAGEVLSLIGPSGSGKSTLLNLIAGFLRPRAGRILLDGRNIESLAVADRPVSIVFQQHNLFPHLDLFTNVALGINPSLKLSQDELHSIERALLRLELNGMEKRKPGELSGGQRQRVALARALVRQRKILLLDEAFAALGPAQRMELISLVRDLVRENKMLAILVSHQPRDASIASERTAFVSDGRIIAVEPTRELLEASELPEVRSYLGSV